MDGMDVWMVIIGLRPSKSTFGANKNIVLIFREVQVDVD